MRQSGRTTKMLIKMAIYLHNNYGRQRTVMLLSHRMVYSFALIERLKPLLELKEVNNGVFRHGNTMIHVESYDSLESDTRRYASIKFDILFTDHYTARGVWIPQLNMKEVKKDGEKSRSNGSNSI